jgi:hypothetical protein
MHCLGCGYALANLSGTVCPECGRSFDPGDPHTFAAAPRIRLRTVLLWNSAAASMLAASITPLYLAWAQAWLILGRPPIPHLDDPKTIPGLTFHAWADSLCLLVPLAFVMQLGVLVCLERQKHDSLAVIHIFIAVATWAVFILLTFIDVFGAVAWYLD